MFDVELIASLGHVYSRLSGQSLLKVSADLEETSVELPAPQVYALHQNYPNPFNPSTQFNYDLPFPGSATLVVYDILGRKIIELVNGYCEAGYHSAMWNASDQASGVYFVRFNATDAEGIESGYLLGTLEC